MKEDNHLIWPDLLKILSIYAVILIHSAAPLLVRYHELGESWWWAGNLYDSLSRWCIPLFVILSGTFLLGKAQGNSLGHFLKRRLQRVLVPLLIWSFIYFLWRIYGNKENLAFSSFLPLLLMEPVYYHLWFLYLIIGLYLLAPVLSIYLKYADHKNVLYFLSLWFLLGSLLPFAESYFEIRTYLSIGTSNSPLKFLGYFILGHFLRDLQLRPAQAILFILLFLFAFFITAYGTYYSTVRQNAGRFDSTFYEYFSVNVFSMSLSLYLVGKSAALPAFFVRMENRFGVFRATAACVPGIYLVHALLIEIAKEGMLGFSFNQLTFPPAIGIPVFALAIFLVSFLIIFIIKQLPLLRNIVP
ncbi:MAG: acyltransferase family protein [Alphaproteobacteria bacterium]|uniref:Acyltransferase family protein n=1 Tax=Candidatus Nitrobium versatile TaxID=2884831 RepID=A0A953M308_9BACT|nr:acyltransferase family protein [Candidatus Nitrobium versatile]